MRRAWDEVFAQLRSLFMAGSWREGPPARAPTMSQHLLMRTYPTIADVVHLVQGADREAINAVAGGRVLGSRQGKGCRYVAQRLAFK